MNTSQIMNVVELEDVSARLPEAWRSVVVGKVGSTQIKVLRMDELAYAPETHDFNEGLLVLSGKLLLQLSDQTVTVDAGQLYLVKAGVPHSVLHGSRGTLIIIDVDLQAA